MTNRGEIRLMQSMRILLVEDDDSIREVFKLMLETASPFPELVVDTAESGAVAIERADQNPPDVILLDLTLPEEHGFEVYKRFRQLNGCASTPIIAVTAHNLSDLEQEAFALGFAGYITKPIDFERELFPLLTCIKDELEKKGAA